VGQRGPVQVTCIVSRRSNHYQTAEAVWSAELKSVSARCCLHLPMARSQFSFKHPEVIDRLLERRAIRVREFGQFNSYKTLTCLVFIIGDSEATLLLRKDN
jgi:hypothetical protein